MEPSKKQNSFSVSNIKYTEKIYILKLDFLIVCLRLNVTLKGSLMILSSSKT